MVCEEKMIRRSFDRLIETLRKEPWARSCTEEEFWNQLAEALQKSFLPDFLSDISNQVDEIIEINPDLPEPEILTVVTHYMVEFLGADRKSTRLNSSHT